MSRDIRSFFTIGSKPKANAPAPSKPVPLPQKRKTIVLESDSDDDVRKPTKTLSTKLDRAAANKKRRIVSSDEDESAVTLPTKTNGSKASAKTPNKKELKSVDVLGALGSGPVKRVERQKKAKATEKDLFNDSVADDLVLMDVDDSLLDGNESQESPNQNNNIREKNGALAKGKASPSKEKDAKNSKAVDKKVEKTESPKKRVERATEENRSPHKSSPNADKSSGSSKKEFKKPKIENKSPEKKSNGKDRDQSNDSSGTPSRSKASGSKPSSSKKEKKEPEENLDYSYSDPDQEKHERKRASAALYKQFQKRAGPANPGSKPIPKGAPNCLAGLNFVLTGVFESLERDEAGAIIKDLGGKVTTALSKKTNYMVVGDEAGPAKLAKAEDMGTIILSEDGLLDLIREKSGIPIEKKKPGNAKTVEAKPSKIKDEKQASPIKKTKLVTSPIVIKKEKNEESFHSQVKKETDVKNGHEVKIKTEFKRPEKGEVALAWVDKYKPKTIKDIIGQQGATSNTEKLTKWLTNWQKNNSGNAKHQKPNPWAKSDDGKAFKATLLSGPPGVGKTTSAQLVAKHLGFDVIEFNASDTRSKKLLQNQVSELLSNKTLHGYFNGNNDKLTEKQVLLMDEVDGMAGNEDRGGIQELINLIKNTSVPIICMCNDRNHQKMRSLINYCFELRFARPRMEQIKGAMLSICCREKIKIPPKTIEEIILATNNDIRQTMNSISLIAAQPDVPDGNLRNDNGRKDLRLGPWEVVRKVFTADEHKTMSLQDKSDLFFNDYSMGPLFVQQTYLTVAPNGKKSETMDKIALTADSLTLGDMVENRIRSRMAWSMLPVQAMYSSVLPGEYMSGTITAQINFPGWLGKYSKTQKRRRLAQELHDHTRLRTSASRQSIRLDYAPRLLKNITQPMIDDGADGVQEALSVMKEYRLLREDLDSLVELCTWPGRKSPLDSVDGRVKAALTRTYNKEVAPYSYSTVTGVKKSKASYDGDLAAEYEGGDGGQGGSSDDEPDDNISNDALIKAKKTTKGASVSKGSKAGTSGTSKAAVKKPAAKKPTTSRKK